MFKGLKIRISEPVEIHTEQDVDIYGYAAVDDNVVKVVGIIAGTALAGTAMKIFGGSKKEKKLPKVASKKPETEE